MSNTQASNGAHARIYVVVFVALLALTIVTVSLSYLHLSVFPSVLLALIVASIKGYLVSNYFMHLISERRLIYAILVLTGIFFLSLIFLPLSHFHDRVG
ncbi:MAG TPA: hypothetical protein DCP63_14110 [Bacteroidetes bacterium]|nr:hypothetical protein [Bacteroidota bacterium]